jgi:hypothetical protein
VNITKILTEALLKWDLVNRLPVCGTFPFALPALFLEPAVQNRQVSRPLFGVSSQGG